MTRVLRFSFEVACGADHAFATWTEQIGLWWSADHTVSGSPTSIVLEALGLAEVTHDARNNKMRASREPVGGGPLSDATRGRAGPERNTGKLIGSFG